MTLRQRYMVVASIVVGVVAIAVEGIVGSLLIAQLSIGLQWKLIPWIMSAIVVVIELGFVRGHFPFKADERDLQIVINRQGFFFACVSIALIAAASVVDVYPFVPLAIVTGLVKALMLDVVGESRARLAKSTKT